MELTTEQQQALERALEARDNYNDGIITLRQMQASAFKYANDLGVSTTVLAEHAGLKPRQINNIIKQAETNE